MRKVAVDEEDGELDLGFPMIRHCSSGRFVVAISNPRKRFGGKSRVGSEEKVFNSLTDEKGFLNEKRFKAMFERLQADGRILPEYTVRKATRNQDERHKIDAWITIPLNADAVHRIPIQIKSSWRFKRKFDEKFGHRVDHIYVIVMDDHITLNILHSVLVDIFNKELAKIKATPAIE